MITLSDHMTNLPKQKVKAGILLLVYAGIWVATLRDFLSPTSLSAILALWTLPFTLHREEGGLSHGWTLLALLLTGLSFAVPVKTLLYFSAGGGLLLLLPLLSYRPSFLSVAVWVVASPAFQYLTNVFSFPIRLQLTGWAGQVLALWFHDITVRGNVIYFGSNEFSVDPACMGLNMLVTSLLLGIMTLGYFQRKEKKQVGWVWALLFLTVVLGLNILSNLLRIMLLVQFAVWPGTLMHDVVGLACLLLYVLLPSALGARWLVHRLGTPRNESGPRLVRPPRLWTQYLLVALITLSAVRVMTVDTYAGFKGAEAAQVPGYTSSVFVPGIIKLENNASLVYVKYVRGFYDTDHNPSLCWKGSGYEFQQVAQTTMAGVPVYTALLVNGVDRLYTAWWYGNGTRHTIDQWEWRYDRFKGAPDYAVINVTAGDQRFLQEEVERVIRQNTLSPLFTKKQNNLRTKEAYENTKAKMDYSFRGRRKDAFDPALPGTYWFVDYVQ